VGDLELKAVRRRLLVQPAAVSRGKRSVKLFEDTTLACGVLGIFMDTAGFIDVIPAASTVLRIKSRFNLDHALHVAGCYLSGIAQAKRHADGNRLVGELLVRTSSVCLGPPCKVMNQSIVGLSPSSETTYPTSHDIPL
jgi:hypothetical protein